MSKLFEANNELRQLAALSDVADLRDQHYRPSLIHLNQEEIPTSEALNVRDQGGLPTCTGFALAAVLDCLRGGTKSRPPVSTVMLYNMARLHDDLPDNGQLGSTLRAALKGLFHNGVCKETLAPYQKFAQDGVNSWELDTASAKDASEVSLGAYYRLHHVVNDYHAAIKETGAILVSARIHDGWKTQNENGEIEYPKTKRELHAFAIVGYTTEGFLVQNSWGKDWGGLGGLPQGVALWTYKDWFENVQDAWVLRLGISSPSAFNFKVASNFGLLADPTKTAQILAPRRQDVFGHYLNLDDGSFVKKGRFTQDAGCIRTISKLLTGASKGVDENPPCKHLLMFAHGALTKRRDCAKRIRAWKAAFRRNGIYPMHIMWQTGFNSYVVDLLADVLLKTKGRMGSNGEHLDERLEEMARPLGRKLWRDLQVSAKETFSEGRDGAKSINQILNVVRLSPGMQVHFVGVSAGSFLLSEFVGIMQDLEHKLSTATLFAPACSVDHYRTKVQWQVGRTIGSVRQFNLSPHREEKDSVDVYNKSLLHLVSNSLEQTKGRRLLGLQSDVELELAASKPLPEDHEIIVAGEDSSSLTNAKSHQGFERDKSTMNSLLEHILGKKPTQDGRFTDAELSGY